MDAAVEYKIENPSESFARVAERFGCTAGTLRNRVLKLHDPHGVNTHRDLSVYQEHALIYEIDLRASRGVWLCPKHIRYLAERIRGEPVGHNWTSRFLARQKDLISSPFYTIKDTARLKDDTAETRKAWYDLVRLLHIHLDERRS